MNEENDLAGLVIRNISDIEAAYHFACLELDDRLKSEVLIAAESSLNISWKIIGEDEDSLINIFHCKWNVVSGIDPDFWLSIEEDVHEGNEDYEIWHSWIATAIGCGPAPSRLVLRFNFNHREFITQARFKKLMAREATLMKSLRQHGFERDGSGKNLQRAIAIDRETLALAFEQDDFDQALLPIREAIADAMRAESDLNILADIVRKEK